MNSNPVIPLNSLSRHLEPVREDLVRAASLVFDSGHYVLGPHLERFERDFAQYCGVAHCVGVANGTDALEIAVKAVGVGRGDFVAVVANAAMYGSSAVLAAGGKLVFVDIELGTGGMDPDSLRGALEANSAIKAVIVTHLYGRLARIDEVVTLARDAGISVVEDCAQAHGARAVDQRRAGSFGDAACFSFYPTKNLGALGDGGAVVTSRDDVAMRVKQLRQYGWSSKYVNDLAGGRNSRLDEMQAAFLSVLLPRLDQWNSLRRAVANRYSREIRNVRIEVPPEAGDEYVAHLYAVKCEARAALQAHLRAEQVQSEIHYPIPDHRQRCLDGRFEGISLPNTESACEHVLSLPCFPEITDQEVGKVIDACNRF